MSENYANDDVIRYTYNDNGDVTAQYKNDNSRPYVTYTYNDDGELTEKINTDTGLKYVYDGDNVSVYKTSDNSLVQSYTETENGANEETGAEAYTTVTENHFGTDYTSVSREKSVSYTTGNNTTEYSYQTTGSDEDEKITSDTVKYNDTNSLSSTFTYDDDGNVTKKTFTCPAYENISVVNEYDDKGRITATGYNTVSQYYSYDNNSQLVRVDSDFHDYTSAYEYDNRGNITSRKYYDYTRESLEGLTPTATDTFVYANSGWMDLLVSVNGTELTYDANGNVLTYGDKEYTWNTGRNLESVVDGDNTYSYTYDENGIRTSKTVNGVTTYYNAKDGVILSQTDGTNTMYFQYDTSGTPLGFIYNGTQYFYMTNQMGDVISITDNQGNELVQYEYDEWGKCNSISLTHEEDGIVANANPIRYRGYYLDSETGYYYLQSRYYDPSICRFINSDIAEISQMSKDIPVGTNLFAYCCNDPVNNSDPTGSISFSSAKTKVRNAVVMIVAVTTLLHYSKYYDIKIPKSKVVYVCDQISTITSVLGLISGVSSGITAVSAIVGIFTGGSTAKITATCGVICAASGIAAGYLGLVRSRISLHYNSTYKNIKLRVYKNGTFKVYTY